MNLIVGVDFDNTIINYDSLIYTSALDRKYVDSSIKQNKKAVRDYIRSTHGDDAWQEIQAFVYGKAIKEAEQMRGVFEFFKKLKQRNIPVFIVSHKTQFAAIDPEGEDLRKAALGWLDQNRFLSSDGLDLTLDQIFFESTRIEKVERIRKLGCTHFIDDLEETFQEEGFPEDVDKILFSPHENNEMNNVTVCNSWEQVAEYVFSM